jgi:hypothetical protein
VIGAQWRSSEETTPDEDGLVVEKLRETLCLLYVAVA